MFSIKNIPYKPYMGCLPRITCGWLSRLIADIPSDDDNTSATIFLPELSNTGIIRVNDECGRESCCRLLSWPLSVWFMSCWFLGHRFGSLCGWFGRLIADIPSDGDHTSVSIFLPKLSDARVIRVNDECGRKSCCRPLSWPLSVWFMSCCFLGHGFGSLCGWYSRLIADIPSDGDYTSVSIFLPKLSDARVIWVNDECGLERC